MKLEIERLKKFILIVEYYLHVVCTPLNINKPLKYENVLLLLRFTVLGQTQKPCTLFTSYFYCLC